MENVRMSLRLTESLTVHQLKRGTISQLETIVRWLKEYFEDFLPPTCFLGRKLSSRSWK